MPKTSEGMTFQTVTKYGEVLGEINHQDAAGYELGEILGGYMKPLIDANEDVFVLVKRGEETLHRFHVIHKKAGALVIEEPLQ